VLQGHVAYYAVPGNSNAVSAFRYQVIPEGAGSVNPVFE